MIDCVEITLLPITSDLVDEPPEPRYDNGEAQFSISPDGLTYEAIDTAADYTDDWWWLDNGDYLEDEGQLMAGDMSFDMAMMWGDDGSGASLTTQARPLCRLPSPAGTATVQLCNGYSADVHVSSFFIGGSYSLHVATGTTITGPDRNHNGTPDKLDDAIRSGNITFSH